MRHFQLIVGRGLDHPVQRTTKNKTDNELTYTKTPFLSTKEVVFLFLINSPPSLLIHNNSPALSSQGWRFFDE